MAAMPSTLTRASIGLLVLALAACSAGTGDGPLRAYTDLRDPELMLKGCFNGNPDGECDRFEALYGIDPRTPDPCSTVGDKLKGCAELVARLKKEAYG